MRDARHASASKLHTFCHFSRFHEASRAWFRCMIHCSLLPDFAITEAGVEGKGKGEGRRRRLTSPSNFGIFSIGGKSYNGRRKQLTSTHTSFTSYKGIGVCSVICEVPQMSALSFQTLWGRTKNPFKRNTQINALEKKRCKLFSLTAASFFTSFSIQAAGG